MSAFPAMTCMLFGTTEENEPSEVGLRAIVRGPITRTVGLTGDTLVVVTPAELPEEWDLTRPMRVVLGDSEGTITLGGYILRRVRSLNPGRDFPPPPPPAPPPPPPGVSPSTFRHAELLLETVPATWRDGRGGLLRAGTLNPLGADGLVDVSHDDYRTNQELVDICLDALGFAHVAAPITLNTAIDDATDLTAPGPLDWGNARVVPELEALLARFGWVACLANDGSQVEVKRLSRAGEPFVPATVVTDHAEPFRLSYTSATRPDRIVITSGRTRTTIISQRSLSDAEKPALVWCSFDQDAGAWVDESEEDMLAAFHAGPIGDDGTTRDFARAFTAVRLAPEEREAYSRFVTLPEAPAVGAFAGFGQAPCVVHARGAALERGGQYTNVPPGGGSMRVDGATAIAGQGVFVLPGSIRFVKMASGHGAAADAAPLTGDELTVLFAHEADTGDETVDYYRSGWKVEVVGGALVTVEPMDAAELAAALDDPAVVKVEAPFLRRIMVWPIEDEDPTPTNDEDLDAIAKQLALARVSAAAAVVGFIPLRGLHSVEPGSMLGAVTAVSWTYADGFRTDLAINQHDAPASFFEELEAAAGRSIGAGLSRLALPGSSVAVSDVLSHSAPGGGPASFAPFVPEAMSATRGRDLSVADVLKKSPAPEPGTSLPGVAEGSEIEAVITGATGGSGNRWSYQWQEAAWDGTGYAPVVGGMSSDTHGLARNLVEYHNNGEGDESQGWNVDDDDPDQKIFLTIKPVMVGAHVRLTRRSIAGDPTWVFDVGNAVHIDTTPTFGEVVRRFKARITGATVFADNDFRWDYDWEELEHTEGGWQTKLGGLTSGGTLSLTFTADASTDKITPAASMGAYPNGAAVQLTTTGTLPAPLATATNYFGRWSTQGSGPYNLYPTLADALAGTNAIDIEDAGTGTHTLSRAALSSGKARNWTEAGNPTSGKIAPGYTLATVPPGFSLRPIMTGTHVEVEGPYQEIDVDGEEEVYVTRWYFRCENALDGECSA